MKQAASKTWLILRPRIWRRYRTTRRYNPEGSNLHCPCSENLISCRTVCCTFSFSFSFIGFTYQPSVHSVLMISLSAMSSECLLFILENWKALLCFVNSSLNSALELLCLYLTRHKVTHAFVKKCGLPCFKNNSPLLLYVVVSCNMLKYISANNKRKRTSHAFSHARSRLSLHVSYC
jgi:predicted neutral ceramidase superfamily lipid hydrolase